MSLRGGQGNRAVVMSSDVPWVQAYTADELSRPGVAIEPMTCPPNAFNSGEDLIALKVGQSHSFTYRLHEVALSTSIGPMVTVCSGPMSTRRPA